ncbi:MAG: hypothetical protein LBQ84_03950 [Flavobacteriaceae bacterium]|jgi:hypothetical protein|nr:hypothetical protein [Flavobacteriaceae bacterium]
MSERNYDPETLHGTHYTEEQFDAEVERRVQAWIKEREDREIRESEINNLYFNYRRNVYEEWNNCDPDQTLRWEMANSMKYTGMQVSGYIKNADENPLLAPIHGFTFKDYAAMAIKVAGGIEPADVCKAMGIDIVVWEELNTLWPQRMAQDASFTLATLYGQYYADNVTHPKLEGLTANISEEGAENLERMRTDPYFYEELNAARTAAYQYGLDGAQWILDNFGINLADFQSVAMKWLTERNQNHNTESIMELFNYNKEKHAEYAAKFAQEAGGNVADDIEF